MRLFCFLALLLFIFSCKKDKTLDPMEELIESMAGTYSGLTIHIHSYGEPIYHDSAQAIIGYNLVQDTFITDNYPLVISNPAVDSMLSIRYIDQFQTFDYNEDNLYYWSQDLGNFSGESFKIELFPNQDSVYVEIFTLRTGGPDSEPDNKHIYQMGAKKIQ